MLANVSQPLLGVVDTAVIGQLPDPFYIGAIAIGALIFSLVYWGFGFLRMGTSGIAAQAYGAGDGKELAAVLYRALLLAAGIGVVLLVLAPLISKLSFWLIAASPDIEREAKIYFDIRIWSAPFSLANYAILGWLIGIGADALGVRGADLSQRGQHGARCAVCAASGHGHCGDRLWHPDCGGVFGLCRPCRGLDVPAPRR